MIMKLFVMFVMYALYMGGNIGDSFSIWKSPLKMIITIYSFDRNDESKLAILPQIFYRNDDLTTLVIWLEGQRSL